MGKKVKGAVVGGVTGFLKSGGNPWGAAAGALGGAMGARSKQRNEGSVTTSMPSWMQGQYDTALGEVNRIAIDPANARQVAGLNADDLGAISGIRSAQGLGADDLAFASGTARELSGAITGDEIRGFYNPYEQDVVDATQRDIDYSRQLAEQNAGSAATAAGAFGGDREAVYKAQLAGDVLRSGGQTIAGLRQGGYRDAMNMAATNRQLRLGGNAQLRDMVDARRSAAYGDAQALAGAGAMQRGVEQAGYDSRYDWNQSRSDTLLRSLGALPGNQGSIERFGASQSSGERAVDGAIQGMGTIDDLIAAWRNRQTAGGRAPSAGSMPSPIDPRAFTPDIRSTIPTINWGP